MFEEILMLLCPKENIVIERQFNKRDQKVDESISIEELELEGLYNFGTSMKRGSS